MNTYGNSEGGLVYFTCIVGKNHNLRFNSNERLHITWVFLLKKRESYHKELYVTVNYENKDRHNLGSNSIGCLHLYRNYILCSVAFPSLALFTSRKTQNSPSTSALTMRGDEFGA